jgi:hypothetical protein
MRAMRGFDMNRLTMIAVLCGVCAACGSSHRPDGVDGGAGDGAPASDAPAGTDGGPRADAPTGPDASVVCGTIAGIPCPTGTYCDFPDGSFCGGDDSGGVCVPIGPGECDLIYAPVCGCDGNTYGNACAADAAGTDVLHDGECETTPTPLCTSETPCTGGGVCYGESCGAPWQCLFTGMACTDDAAPYCGCDGATFYDSSTCPTRPWAHRGECDPASGG